MNPEFIYIHFINGDPLVIQTSDIKWISSGTNSGTSVYLRGEKRRLVARETPEEIFELLTGKPVSQSQNASPNPFLK